MNRRTLLRNLAYTLGGAALLDSLKTSGQAMNTAKISRIGLQLYTVRKNTERDLAATLQQVAAIGIKEVEFAGYFNQTPTQLKTLLKELNLAVPSAHISLETLRTNLPKAIDEAKTIGHQYLVLAYLAENERKSLDNYKKLADLLNQSGEQCRRAGLQIAYHNHDFEFKQMDGQIPYDLILAETDSGLVKMEMDLYWIVKAGFDPLTYFDKYPQRFPLVHVKDMDATPNKAFTEVGRGTIDFKKIFAKSKQAGIKHYFIEQDETPGEPIESVKISLDYLRNLKF